MQDSPRQRPHTTTCDRLVVRACIIGGVRRGWGSGSGGSLIFSGTHLRWIHDRSTRRTQSCKTRHSSNKSTHPPEKMKHGDCHLPLCHLERWQVAGDSQHFCQTSPQYICTRPFDDQSIKVHWLISPQPSTSLEKNKCGGCHLPHCHPTAFVGPVDRDRTSEMTLTRDPSLVGILLWHVLHVGPRKSHSRRPRRV